MKNERLNMKEWKQMMTVPDDTAIHLEETLLPLNMKILEETLLPKSVQKIICIRHVQEIFVHNKKKEPSPMVRCRPSRKLPGNTRNEGHSFIVFFL